MQKKTFIILILGLFVISLIFVLPSGGVLANEAVINLDPSRTYQVITGWGATAQAGQLECSNFNSYKDSLFDQAVDDLGINRLRLPVRSGSENPIDYFTLWKTGQITNTEWRNHRYEIVNDNPNPDLINQNNFHFTEIDNSIDEVVLPLKQRVEANGEHLYINATYVDFGSSTFEHKTNPLEYAEFVLATYQHLQSKYGWTPDVWEVILEPDTSAASWDATQIGYVVAATAIKLQMNGFTPNFTVPSTTNMDNTVPMFDQLIQIPNALPYISELAYHRYAGVSDANLQAIAGRGVQDGIDTAMLEHIGSGYQDLHKDLKMGRNSAWQQFALAFCTNDDGAQYYWIDESNPNNPSINMGSRTEFLRQYFKFIRSGAVRIEATGDNTNIDPLGFINPDGKYVVVVQASQGESIAIQNLPAGAYGIKYTTNSQYGIDLPSQTIQGGQSLITSIPESGVITIYGISTIIPTSTVPPNPANSSYIPFIVK